MSNPNIASRFDEIYEKTSKSILAYTIAKCGRTSDVSDIFQETYMELYRVLCNRGIQYVTNDRALVYKIAKRKIAKYFSMLERLKGFFSLTPSEFGNNQEFAEFDCEAFYVEDFAVNHVLVESVKQELYSKPEDVQKVFYLYFEVGLTLSEIAEILALTESSVKNKLYRTLSKIKELLE